MKKKIIIYVITIKVKCSKKNGLFKILGNEPYLYLKLIQLLLSTMVFNNNKLHYTKPEKT